MTNANPQAITAPTATIQSMKFNPWLISYSEHCTLENAHNGELAKLWGALAESAEFTQKAVVDAAEYHATDGLDHRLASMLLTNRARLLTATTYSEAVEAIEGVQIPEAELTLPQLAASMVTYQRRTWVDMPAKQGLTRIATGDPKWLAWEGTKAFKAVSYHKEYEHSSYLHEHICDWELMLLRAQAFKYLGANPDVLKEANNLLDSLGVVVGSEYVNAPKEIQDYICTYYVR